MAKVIKVYYCEDCDEDKEVLIETSRTRKTCPDCKSKSFEQVVTAPIIAKTGDAKTLGVYMERNSKRNPLSAEKALGDTRTNKTKEHFKKLNNMQPHQKEKYIHTGEGVT